LIVIALVLFGCTKKPDHRIHLRFWHAWGGHEAKTLEALVAEYNAAHPDVVVEPSFLSIGDKLLAAIAGGKPPDIATVWTYMIAAMGDSGCFLPLEDRLQREGITEADYLPNVWQHGMSGQHRWGIATTLNTQAIYYNTRAVREAGLDPGHPPTTVAELEQWAARLTRLNPDGTLEQLGFAPVLTDSWIYSFGGEIADPTGRFVLDQPGNVRALTWMKHMYDQVGGIQNVRRFTASAGKSDSPDNPLFTGKLAMKEDGQWIVQFFHEYAPQVDYGVFAFPPAEKGGTGYTTFGGSFWCIPVGCRHPDEAWQFISWLTSAPQSARFCAALKNIPPRKAALEHPDFLQARNDPKFDFFVRLIADGKARAPITSAVGQQERQALDDGVQEVFSGSVTPEAFLAKVNRSLNEELKRSAALLASEDR
jgi:multiple sugar transport system substrate-binding protein